MLASLEAVGSGMVRWILLACVTVAGCNSAPGATSPTGEAPQSAALAPTSGRSITVDADEQWGEVGCTPEGNERWVQGRYEVDQEPKADGKRLRGAWLAEDSGTRWLLSYAGGRFHPELSGRRVWARGRSCSKQGQSVFARHFAIVEIVVP